MRKPASFGWGCLLATGLLAGVAGCAGDPAARKQAFLESGNRYIAEGQFRHAILELRNAVALDPAFGEARARLAEAYTRDGDLPNALSEYVRAADLLPKDYDLQMRAGGLLLVSQKADEALARADAALRIKPGDVAALILRGNALAGLNSFDEALAAIEQAIKLDPKRDATFTHKGLIEMARGKGAEAEAAFKKAVELAPQSVQPYLALANFYWASGRAPETEQALRSALRVDGEHIAANRAMAALLMAVGRPAAAEEYLQRVVDVSKDPLSALMLADYYLVVGRTKDAIARLEPLASSASPVQGAQQRLARAYAAAGDRAKARSLIEGTLKASPQDLPSQLLKGQLLADEGRRDEAVAALRAAVQSNPSSAEAHFALGRLYLMAGDAAAAESSFREVLKINPRVSAAQVELSKLLLASGSGTASVRSAEEATANDPTNGDARIALVRGLIATRDFARAERELATLRRDFPDSAQVHAQSGALALFRDDVTSARQSFERAVEIDRNVVEGVTGLVALELRAGNTAAARALVDSRLGDARRPDLLLLAARTHAATNDMPGAEKLLRQAIAADPSLLPAYTMLGEVYVSQGKLDLARQEFDTLATRQAKPVAALTMSGMILQAQGNNAEATRRYEGALAADPRAAIAANNLAWLYAESGENLDAAQSLAQTATTATPDVPEMMDTLGWVYYKKGLPQLAIPLFARSAQKLPANANYHYHLGLAYLQAKDITQGHAALRRALAAKPDQKTSEAIQRLLNAPRSSAPARQ